MKKFFLNVNCIKPGTDTININFQLTQKQYDQLVECQKKELEISFGLFDDQGPITLRLRNKMDVL